MNAHSLTTPGRFMVGCNYWASHAGTAMWVERPGLPGWRPDIVEADLAQLAAAGLQVLRVFPLWSDFQPLSLLRTYQAAPAEYRHGELPLSGGEGGIGPDGLSQEALARFAWFADCADRHGLKLLVGLLAGWMSGRLFVPPALAGRNVLTDPLALMWETRFVRGFVRRFRSSPAIIAWDLGNECNCMAPVSTTAEAWAWTSAIANAIRVEDPSHPVVSGMHGLEAGRDAVWRIQDQGELTDLLTTHPYPIFTPYCDQDPVNTLRPGLHATAQSCWYADLGGRPCLAEELGTLGPMIASEAVAAAYVRTALLSLWAHGCTGLLWWCAYDQVHLAHAPYDWHAYERELGLIRADRTPKPALAEFSRFGAWLEGLPIAALPPRVTEAVCILTEGQDQWAVAFASFILAKQAGFDLAFQHADQPLKAAGLYLLPAVRGGGGLSRHTWLALLERVYSGATLYLSHHDGLLAPFNEPFGLAVQTRERRIGPAEIMLDALSATPALRVEAPVKLRLSPDRAEVLGRESDGNPAFTRAALGRGQVYFLSAPIEDVLSRIPAAFHGPTAQPFWQIYRQVAAGHLAGRVLHPLSGDLRSPPQVGVTEHPLPGGERVIVLINYGPEPAAFTATLQDGWRVAAVWRGPEPEAAGKRLQWPGWAGALPANDAAVILVSA